MKQKLFATWVGMMIVTSAFVMAVGAEDTEPVSEVLPAAEPSGEDFVWAPDLTGQTDADGIGIQTSDGRQWTVPGSGDVPSGLLSSGSGSAYGRMMAAERPADAGASSSGRGGYSAGGGGDHEIASDPGAKQNVYVDSVLLVHADDGNGEPLRSQLDAYPDIGTVDIFDARSATPDLPTLLGYDVVVTWSNYAYLDVTGLGDVLADYVDAGGCVVQGTFNWVDSTGWGGPQGRFTAEGYSPLVSLDVGNHFTTASLGWFDAAHRLMAGVTAAGDEYRDYTALDPGATLVASWDDGENFVAVKGNVVGINSYVGTYYQYTGDLPLIFHNAVTYTQSLATPWFDDMESGENGWTYYGLWHQVWDSVSPYPDYHSYETSWWYGQDSTGDYDDGDANAGRLETPMLELTGTGSVLAFWEWYETEGSPDHDQRWIQVDDGTGWQDLVLLDRMTMSTWQERVVDLSAYDGQTVSIGFYFSTVDDIANGYRGWYIDDVLVGCLNDARLEPEAQRGFGVPGGQVSYMLHATNNGLSDDTYDLMATSSWPVDFYGLDGLSASQLNNPSFETGDFTGWDATDLSGPFSPLQVSGAGNNPGGGFFDSAPTDGIYSLQNGFDGNGPGHILAGQDFDVPLANSVLMFDYRAAWDLETIPATIDRTFSVLIEPSGGGPPIESHVILVAPANTYVSDTGILQGLVDLMPYAGTTVYIEFDWWVPESMSGPAFFELDNIRITETALISQIGPLAPGETMDFLATVGVPGGAGPGDFDIADIYITSQADPAVQRMAQTETVVPFWTDWYDGFETGWGAWTFTEQMPSSTQWEIGDPSGAGPGSAFAGTECAGTNLWDAYYPGTDMALVTPWVRLSGGQQVLSFWTWYDMETDGDDGGFVEVRGAGDWMQIQPTYGSHYWGYPYTDAYCSGYMTDAFSGTSDGWEFYEFDLSAFAGQAVQARFHFASSPWWGGDWGWYLDDIFMGAPPQYRADLFPAQQVNFGLPGADVDYTMRIANSGTEADSYDLYSTSVWPIEFWSSPTQTLVSEDFEGRFPPPGWTLYDWNSWGDPLGEWHRNDYTGYPNWAGAGYCAEANSDAMSNWWTGSGGVEASLTTPEFSLDGFPAAGLEFDMCYYDLNLGSDDYAYVVVYYDGMGDLLAYYDEDHSPTGPGENIFIDLTPWVGYDDVSIEFYYYDSGIWAGWWQIDNVHIYGDTGIPPAPITSVGPVDSGGFLDFTARCSIPGGAMPGDSDLAYVSAESWNDPGAGDSAMLTTIVPGGILLVDDDGGLSVETYYLFALDDYGLPHTCWDTTEHGCPAAEFMDMFDAVVWTTGDLSGGTTTLGSPEDTLDSKERGELSTYLDNGGRLFLSSGGFGWDSAFNIGTGWMNNYLGANPWNGDYGFPYDMLGVPGDPIGDGLDMCIHTGDYWAELSGVWTWNDPAAPNAAIPIVWDPDMAGASMHYAFAGFRTVFTGFDLADVDGADDRAELMERILDWLLAEDSVEMTPEHQEFAYMPDTTVIYSVEVTNRMAFPDTFDLYFDYPSAWNTRIMDETASFDITQTSNLDPGQSFRFTIVVDIPMGASPSEWDLAVVSVASWTDPSISATAETFTQVWVEPHAFDEFEGAFYDFRAFGSGATAWEIGDPSGFGPGAAYSPDNCWGTNLADDYYPEADIALVSHYFTLGLASWSEMSFHHWYDTDGMDGGSVEITADFGQTWTQITPVGGYDWMNWWGIDSFSGFSGGWLQEQFDLSPYLGETVSFRMRFMSSPATGGYPGWYIDDFDVDAAYPDRGCLLTPVLQQGFELPGGSIDYGVSITNIGTLGNDSFDLDYGSMNGWTAQFLDLGYSPITAIGPLEYGESQSFIVRVDIPGFVNPGDIEYTWPYGQSQADPAEWDWCELFSQAYADLLLVDDDLGIDSEDWYTDSLDWLDTMGYASYNFWDVATYGAPSYADMSQYIGVIWATGNSYGVNGPSLTAADRTNIQDYLLNGGSIYLTGDMFWMDAAENGWTDWLGQWFGAVPVDGSMGGMGYGWDMFGSAPQTLAGENGDPIGDGLGFPMDAPGSCPSVWGSYAILEIVDPAAVRSCYFSPGLGAGATTMVRMDGGGFRSVISSFDHSKMGDEPERTAAMAEIMSWLVTRTPISSNALVDGTPVAIVQPGTLLTLIGMIESNPYFWWNTVEGALYTFGEGNFPGVAMNPADGDFDGPIEWATSPIDTTGWPDGQYDLYIYGWDSVTNYQTESTAFASIIVDGRAPSSHVIQEGSYWRSEFPTVIRAEARDSNLINENFDGGIWPPTGWSVDGICSASQSGNPTLTHYWSMMDDSLLPLPNSLPYCAGVWWSDGSGGDPPAREQDEWLISPEMDFSSYSTVELEFWSAYTMLRYGSSATSHDYVRVSTDGGSTWDIVADLAHDPAYDFDGLTGGPGGPGWNWYEVPILIDLSAYAGEPSVMMAWNYLAETPIGSRGVWMVDDIMMYGDGILETSSGLASVDLYYRYSADNAMFGAWTYWDTLFGAPWDFEFYWPYGEGYYEFYTVAEDNAGIVEAAPFFADAAYAYETSIPWSNVILTEPYLNLGPSRVITADAGNGLSGVQSVELWVRHSPDNSTWSIWTLHSTDNAIPWQWTFTANADGYYQFYTRARDFAGNYEDEPGAADAAWLFDLVCPSSNAIQTMPDTVNISPMTIEAEVGFSGTLINEQFEGAWPPAGWTVVNYGGDGVWQRNDMWAGGRPNYAGGSGFCADADSDRLGSGTTMNTGLRTPSFNLVGASVATLDFIMSYNFFIGSEYAAVRVSTDGGGLWTNIDTWNWDVSPSGPGAPQSYDLSAYIGEPNVMIEFYYYCPGWNWWFEVDNVQISMSSDPVASLELWYRHSLDGAGWGAWTYFDTDTGPLWEFDFDWPDGEGFYEFYTIAIDDWGWRESPPATADAAYRYDTTNPTVIWTSPPDGAINVPVTAGTFRIHFNEAMDTGLGLVDTSLPGTVWTWSADGTWLNGTYGGLAYTTMYNVNLETGGFTDLVGNPLTGDGNFTFTTAGTEYASATGPTSSGSQDPRPAITYTYGGTITAVDIYYTNDGGTSWNFWGQDVTLPDFAWTPTTDLPSDGTYYWCAQANGFEPVPVNPTFIESGPYVYDVTPPSSSVDPVVPYWNNAPKTLTATAFDATSGIAWVEFFYAYSADNVTWGAPVSLGSDFAAPYTRAFNWPNGNGYYLFYCTAVDAAGNLEAQPGVADAVGGYDGTPPAATVDMIPEYWQNSSPLTVTATALDGLNPVASVELVYWFSPDGIAWGGPSVFAVDSAAPWQWSFTYPNGTGYYRFAARAYDTLGNAPAWPPGGYDVEIGFDNITPSSTVIFIPPYEQTAVTMTVMATAGDAGPSGLNYTALYYRYSADNSTWGGWTWFGLDDAAPWEFAFDWPMGLGYYQFYTIASDHAENTEAAPPVRDAEWFWNPPAPITSLDQYSPYWLNAPVTLTATVMGTGNPVSYVELWYSWSVNNISWGPWAVFSTDFAAPWEFPFDYTPSGEGYYMFFTRGMDTLGNYESPPAAADAFNAYDATDPASSVTPAGAYWQVGAPFTIGATASDSLSGVGGVDFYCRHSANNATWSGWIYMSTDLTAPYSMDFMWPFGEGYYEFASQAWDRAMNTEAMPGTADAAYGYDTAAPATSMTAGSFYWHNGLLAITAFGSDAMSGLAGVNAYYRYSADNVTWGAWTQYGSTITVPVYQWTFTFPDGDGYYELYSEGVDLAGNWETYSGVDARVGYDTASPTTAADVTGAYWRITSPITITATGSDALSNISNVDLWMRYSADNVTWSAWSLQMSDATAPYSFSFAFGADGFYQFQTRGVDRAGNQEALKPAEVSYGYDATAPSTNVNFVAPYARATSPLIPTVSGISQLNGFGSIELWYRFSSDNATWSAWALFATDTLAPFDFTFDWPDGEGFYEFYSRSTDGLGNYESAPASADAAWAYDITAPDSAASVPGAYASYEVSRTVDATVSDAVGGVRNVTLWFRWSADNATWGEWVAFGTDYAAPWSWLFTMPNGTGYYEFYTIAVDNADNGELPPASADDSCRRRADTNPPTSSVTVAGPYWLASGPLTVEATASDSEGTVASVMLWYRFSTDNATWGGWNSFGTDTAAPWSWSFGFASGQGFYQFYTTATDSNGQVEAAPSSADAAWAYDATAPTVTVTALPAYTTVATFNIAFTATDSGGLAYYVLYYTTDGGSTWTATPTHHLISPISFTASSDGAFGFYIVAFDLAGNHRTVPIGGTVPDTATIVDRVAPTATVVPSGTNISIGTNITVTFSEPVGQTAAQAAFSLFPAVTGTFVWNTAGTVMTFVPGTSLAYGTTYTVNLTASGITDIAGNLMAADMTRTFTTQAQPQTPSGSLRGRVLDGSGAGIEGATVSLQGTSLTATTDANGNYAFASVPAGSYTIQASKEGYQSGSTTASVAAGTATAADDIILALEEDGGSGSVGWIIPVLLIALLVAGLLVFMLLKKKKKSGPEEPDDPDGGQDGAEPAPEEPQAD